MPGTYTIKMTKGDKVYTAPLHVVLDPRATYTVEDRKAQFDLAVQLSKTMGHMSYGVAAIEGVRDASNRQLPPNFPQRTLSAHAWSIWLTSQEISVPRSWPQRKVARSPVKNGFASTSAKCMAT